MTALHSVPNMATKGFLLWSPMLIHDLCKLWSDLMSEVLDELDLFQSSSTRDWMHLWPTSVRVSKPIEKEQKKPPAQQIARWGIRDKEPVTSCPTMTLFHYTLNCKVLYFCKTTIRQWWWNAVALTLHLFMVLCTCSCTKLYVITPNSVLHGSTEQWNSSGLPSLADFLLQVEIYLKHSMWFWCF